MIPARGRFSRQERSAPAELSQACDGVQGDTRKKGSPNEMSRNHFARLSGATEVATWKSILAKAGRGLFLVS